MPLQESEESVSSKFGLERVNVVYCCLNSALQNRPIVIAYVPFFSKKESQSTGRRKHAKPNASAGFTFEHYLLSKLLLSLLLLLLLLLLFYS